MADLLVVEFLLSTVTYCLLGLYNSLCTLLLKNTPNVCFFLTVTDQVSHPRQTKRTVTFLYPSPFMLCVAKHCAPTDGSHSLCTKCS